MTVKECLCYEQCLLLDHHEFFTVSKKSITTPKSTAPRSLRPSLSVAPQHRSLLLWHSERSKGTHTALEITVHFLLHMNTLLSKRKKILSRLWKSKQEAIKWASFLVLLTKAILVSIENTFSGWGYYKLPFFLVLHAEEGIGKCPIFPHKRATLTKNIDWFY